MTEPIFASISFNTAFFIQKHWRFMLSLRHNADEVRSTFTFPLKTGQALLWFCGLVALIYFGPFAMDVFGLSRAQTPPEVEGGDPAEQVERIERPSVENLARAVLGGPQSTQPRAMPAILAAGAPEDEPLPEPGSNAASEERRVVIEDPSSSMTAFYEALGRTTEEESTSLTRIIHYGDSMLTGDTISGAARRVLQHRFGHGGHGFVLPGRPWPWYRHQGVTTWNSNGFRINRITANPTADGCLGLGAVSFRTFQGGARFMVEPVDGEVVSRFILYYLAQPNGGDVTLSIDDATEENLSTAADERVSRAHEIDVPEGTHRLNVRYDGRGEVRVFGVAVERRGPGVVYDSLGVNGLHASNFQRYDQRHIAEQIGLRSPDLIVVMLGTNESQNQYLNLDRHGEDYGVMLSMLREGVDRASCLVISPPDRVLGEVGTRRSLMASIVTRQREVAIESGCAFWNTFEAMGGSGSAAAWRRRTPPLLGGDLTHPTPAGAERLGSQIAEALISGFEQWRQQNASPPPPVQNPL